jgi:hypothetical protein
MRIDANLEDSLTERLMTEKCRPMGHFSVITRIRPIRPIGVFSPAADMQQRQRCRMATHFCR